MRPRSSGRASCPVVGATRWASRPGWASHLRQTRPAGSELLFLTLLLVGQFLKQEKRRWSFLGWIKSQSKGAAASARETRALVCPSSKGLGGCRPSLHRTVWVLRERSPWQAAPQPAAEVTLEPCFAGRAHVSPCLSTSGPRAPLGGQLCPQGKPARPRCPPHPDIRCIC